MSHSTTVWDNKQKLQPGRGFDTYSLIACLAISAFLIVWITLATGSFNLRSALFLLVLPWVLLRAGGIISAATGLPLSEMVGNEDRKQSGLQNKRFRLGGWQAIIGRTKSKVTVETREHRKYTPFGCSWTWGKKLYPGSSTGRG